MGKKLTVTLIVFIVLNILLSALLIFDVKSFELPVFDVHVEVLDIGSDTVTLDTSVEMKNTNSYSVSITNLDVDIQTDNGDVVGSLQVKGGELPAKKTKTFHTTSEINLKDYDAGLITSRIRGDLKIDFVGVFTKTIPVDISVTSALDLLFNNVIAPEISVDTKFGELSNQGVPLNVNLTFNNPNSFSLYINDLDIYTYHDEADETAHITIEGGELKPGDTTEYSGSMILGFNTFNFGILRIHASGEAGVKIAGFRHFIPLAVDASMEIPRIEDFLFNDQPLEISIKVDFKTLPQGMKTIVGMEIYNPGNININANNLICYVYKVDGEDNVLVGQDPMDSCDVYSGNKACAKTEIIIPYSEFTSEGGEPVFPEWFLITIVGKMQFGSTNQMLPFEVGGYFSPSMATEN